MPRAQPLALNVGSITRNLGGTLVLTNPSGTPSATNGLQTTSGSAGALLTSNGVPYVVVRQRLGGQRRHEFVCDRVFLYTASTATTLSGNANVVTDVNLASGGSAGSIRFNDSTRAHNHRLQRLALGWGDIDDLCGRQRNHYRRLTPGRWSPAASWCWCKTTLPMC